MFERYICENCGKKVYRGTPFIVDQQGLKIKICPECEKELKTIAIRNFKAKLEGNKQ